MWKAGFAQISARCLGGGGLRLRERFQLARCLFELPCAHAPFVPCSHLLRLYHSILCPTGPAEGVAGCPGTGTSHLSVLFATGRKSLEQTKKSEVTAMSLGMPLLFGNAEAGLQSHLQPSAVLS